MNGFKSQGIVQELGDTTHLQCNTFSLTVTLWARTQCFQMPLASLFYCFSKIVEKAMMSVKDSLSSGSQEIGWIPREIKECLSPKR